MIIGIDIGGSTTKIIGYESKKLLCPMIVHADDPKASVYGAFGKYLDENNLKISDISRVVVTGVGSSFLSDDLFGIETVHEEEFLAVGHGGLKLSGLEKAVVVSMGTGTAFVAANSRKREVEHLGGTGVGGGTLIGLSDRILNMRHFDDIIKVAENGDLTKVDISVGDISSKKISTMLPSTTASNFGKLDDLASGADIALGIINMVFQTIGVISTFAAKLVGTKNVVLTGNLTNVPQARSIFDGLEKLYEIKFIIPENAEYATAIGAAMSGAEEL